jgi:membrane-associated phospholipid phosphatase
MIEKLDVEVFHLINGWCGTFGFDHFADLAEHLFLLTGVIALSAYSWLWFEGQGVVRDKQRGRLVAQIIGTFIAIAASRFLAHILPFRVRPLYAGIGYHAPSFHILSNYESWSSFPSDHAAMFFALAFGVFLLWRGAGLLLMIYAAVWVCLPRIFLGLHYPSDILVGAIIGIACAAACSLMSETRAYVKWVAKPTLALEKNRPTLFYTLAIAGLAEMASMFSDVRYLMNNLQFLAHLGARNTISILAIGSICVIIVWRVIANRTSGQRQMSDQLHSYRARLVR